MAKDTITVLGRKISYEIKDVDIHSIQYYSENPRINYIISKNPPEKITQEFIGEELLKLNSTKERINDLEENKGLLDEVYVLGDKVVEGNTRLCAFRRLANKHPDDPRWKHIKARILHDGVTDEELFYILGVFHIKGKTEWDAYEKAAYIHKMIRHLHKTPEEIGKQLGKAKRSVESMLRAYETMSQKYLFNSGEEQLGSAVRDELKKYSYFEAFFLQKDLAERAEKTPAFVDQFVEWVKDEKFKRARDVRDLPKILNNKKAFRVFNDSEEEDSFDEAMHILFEQKPEKVDRFYKKIRAFRNLIKDSAVLKIKEEIKDNKNKKTELKKCYKDLRKFCKEIGLDIK